MIKAAIVCGEQLSKAAQESARHCQRFGEAFRGVVSVALLRRRALMRLQRVQDRVTTIALNILMHVRVAQNRPGQLDASGNSPSRLSHFWLHGAEPYTP